MSADTEKARQLLKDAQRLEAEWMTISAYAIKYGVSRNTVYKWLEADLLEVLDALGVRRLRDKPPQTKQHHSAA